MVKVSDVFLSLFCVGLLFRRYSKDRTVKELSVRYVAVDGSLLYPPSVLILDKTEQEVICDTIIYILERLEAMKK